jgi:hypothetical protein
MNPRRFASVAAVVVAVCVGSAPAPARAADADAVSVQVHGLLDARALRTDRTRSWMDGALGKTRYGPPVTDAPATLLRLSQASLLVDAPVGDLVAAHLQINGDADGDFELDSSRLDLIQAFIEVKPEPSPRLRLRARLGVFFPPVSQEADEPAWTGPYTITPSAATSWIADELRTIGAEVRLALRPEGQEISVTGAVLGGNDPTGSLLAWRGWAMGDRQTGLSDRPRLAPIPSIEPNGLFEQAPRWVQPFREIDGRVGYYAAASYRKTNTVDVRVIHYDNDADETVFDGQQYAWHTQFSSAAARLRIGAVELLGQHLRGGTLMGRTAAGRPAVDCNFWTTFGLLSLSVGRHRLSARYDEFYVEDDDEYVVEDPNEEHGHAWTAAYSLKTGEAHRLALEVLQVDSRRAVRPQIGLPEHARETLVQASFRVRF